MKLLKSAAELTLLVKTEKGNSLSVGFVPTMGALHEGHISLIENSRRENSLTVCSIFVNPTQFNNPDDFKKYPKTIEKDIEMLEKWGCDVLFLPEVEEIYQQDVQLKHYNLGYLETLLEGKYRPGHFQGVCQVVDRLLEIVIPDKLYIGQKDYQQCMVISKLVELRKYDCKIVICPTLREPDGLAMSSRNLRLNTLQRKLAVNIFETMQLVKSELKKGETGQVKHKAENKLSKAGFRVDYVEVSDAKTLEPIINWDGYQEAVVLIAAYLDDIRLIDNMLFDS